MKLNQESIYLKGKYFFKNYISNFLMFRVNKKKSSESRFKIILYLKKKSDFSFNLENHFWNSSYIIQSYSSSFYLYLFSFSRSCSCLFFLYCPLLPFILFFYPLILLFLPHSFFSLLLFQIWMF